MIEVQIAGIPKRPNELRTRHWGANAEEAADWRFIAGEAGRRALFGRPGSFPIARASVEYVFVLERAAGDLDGLVAAAKPLLDGLRDAGILADDNVNAMPELHVRWVRGAKKGVVIRVREIE